MPGKTSKRLLDPSQLEKSVVAITTAEKKGDQHLNAFAPHFIYYNSARIHALLRMALAMAAGVTERLWEIADIVALTKAKKAEADSA